MSNVEYYEDFNDFEDEINPLKTLAVVAVILAIIFFPITLGIILGFGINKLANSKKTDC